MLLAIDIGNSNISVGLFDRQKELRFLASLDTDSRKTADQISIDLLNLFMSNIGKIYSRDELLETIWGFDYIGDFRTVDVHIRRLREKIEKDPANPKHIMTKWGVGYYFAE